MFLIARKTAKIRICLCLLRAKLITVLYAAYLSIYVLGFHRFAHLYMVNFQRSFTFRPPADSRSPVNMHPQWWKLHCFHPRSEQSGRTNQHRKGIKQIEFSPPRQKKPETRKTHESEKLLWRKMGCGVVQTKLNFNRQKTHCCSVRAS